MGPLPSSSPDNTGKSRNAGEEDNRTKQNKIKILETLYALLCALAALCGAFAAPFWALFVRACVSLWEAPLANASAPTCALVCTGEMQKFGADWSRNVKQWARRRRPPLITRANPGTRGRRMNTHTHTNKQKKALGELLRALVAPCGSLAATPVRSCCALRPFCGAFCTILHRSAPEVGTR